MQMLNGKMLTWPVFKPLAAPAKGSRELWRSLFLLNIYRLLLGCLLLTLVWVAGNDMVLGQRDLPMFYRVNIVYIVFTLLALPLVKLQRPSFNLQLGIQIGTDIVCIVLLS